MEKAAHTPVSEKICVLYDQQDGRIVHTHRVVVMPGGQEMTDDEIEARAKECAKQVGHVIDDLGALRLAAMDHDNAAAYRVDIANKKLVKRRRELSLRPLGS
jgi:hypothetical protein